MPSCATGKPIPPIRRSRAQYVLNWPFFGASNGARRGFSIEVWSNLDDSAVSPESTFKCFGAQAFYFENEGQLELAATTYDEIRLLWCQGEDRHLALSGLLFASAFYADNDRARDVADCVVDCFYKGGGVPYSAFSRFHDVMAEDSGQNIVAALPDHILPLVPGLTTALQNGINVLDIGCGRGRALHLLAEKFPNSRFTGCDLSDEAIAYARSRANNSELRNLRLRGSRSDNL
jgi:hypothetical protein